MKFRLGCCCRALPLGGGGSQVQSQEPAYFSVEIDLASLDARSKKCGLPYFENLSRQAEAIGMDEPSNADTVSYFQLSHVPHTFERCLRTRKELSFACGFLPSKFWCESNESFCQNQVFFFLCC